MGVTKHLAVLKHNPLEIRVTKLMASAGCVGCQTQDFVVLACPAPTTAKSSPRKYMVNESDRKASG